MKRIFTFCTVILMLFASAAYAFADETETTSECVVESNTLHRGDTVEVSVVLSNCPKLKSMGIIPTYDSDVFELVSAEWLLIGAFIENFDAEKEGASVAFVNEVDANGKVLTFTLRVKDDAAFGETSIHPKMSVRNGTETYACTEVETKLTIACKHNFTDCWNNDDECHWQKCQVEGCEATAEEGEHVYDNACDAVCNICEYTRTIEHTYSTVWSSDGTQHWHACVVCGEKKDVEAHKFVEVAENAYLASEANCKSPAVYYKSCSICGAKGVETFTFAGVNSEKHTGNTEVKDAVEATCTTDGYTGDIYCKDCGSLLQEGTVIKAGHSYSEEYKSDEEKHWKECECGCKDAEESHQFGDWKVTKKATATEAGSKERSCSVCGYVQSEAIAATGTGQEDNPTTGDDMTWIYLLGIALSCGVGSITLYNKKRQKQ